MKSKKNVYILNKKKGKRKKIAKVKKTDLVENGKYEERLASKR